MKFYKISSLVLLIIILVAGYLMPYVAPQRVLLSTPLFLSLSILNLRGSSALAPNIPFSSVSWKRKDLLLRLFNAKSHAKVQGHDSNNEEFVPLIPWAFRAAIMEKLPQALSFETNQGHLCSPYDIITSSNVNQPYSADRIIDGVLLDVRGVQAVC
ncbi:hypothetical protein LguiB_013554 [Lonicera macranthoides]